MIFRPMTLKDASKLYDDIQQNMLPCTFRYDLLDDLVFFTENFTRDYGTPQKQVKYYIELRHCDDGSNYALQSKWFDTLEQAREWYKNDIDFVGEDYDAYIMYAEYDTTSDSYGDIEQLEQLTKE